jgi:hypothetical protein
MAAELETFAPFGHLYQRVKNMIEENLPPVEGFVTWLKYVLKNLFRVAELNKVLTVMQVRGLSKYGKMDKLDFLLYLLESDHRCYLSMGPYGDYGARIASIVAPPNNRILRDQYYPTQLKIHPGLAVKLVYWETVMNSGFRYEYHNQMLQEHIIGAMGKLPASEETNNGKNAKYMVLNDRAGSSQGARLKVFPSSDSPLKLRIKQESLHSQNANSFKKAADSLRSGCGGVLPMQYQNCTIIDCICGRNQDNGEPMFQCTGCGIWQHKKCILGTSDLNDMLNHAKVFKLCFQCRIKMADPFYCANMQFKFPYNVSFTTAFHKQQYGRPQSSSRLKEFRRAFTISEKVFRLLWDKKNKLYLALACLLVQDKVQNRINLPKNADVHVNGRSIKMYSRCSSKELSDNGRDMLIDISQYMVIGENLVSMTSRDMRNFVLSVQIYEEKSLEDVKKMIRNIEAPTGSSQSKLLLKQKIREKQALFKVRGDELGFESITVSLICPFSGTRMKYPVKATVCRHAKVFDGETFLQVNHKTKKWQCPHCMKAILVTDLELDLFMVSVLERLKAHSNVSDIEINKEGKWRPYRKKAKREKDYWFSAEEEYNPKLEYLIPETAHVINEEENTTDEAQPNKKENPDNENGGEAAAAAPPPGDENKDESESESEELDEAEELRRAIAASGIQRKPKPPPEVIDLISSDEEEETPNQRPQQHMFQPTNQARAFPPPVPRAFKRLRTSGGITTSASQRPQTGNPLLDFSQRGSTFYDPYQAQVQAGGSGPDGPYPSARNAMNTTNANQSIQQLFGQENGNIWSSFVASVPAPSRQANQEEVIELD